jgi:Ran GTPase-activating protein (RanGAP) involved in mRNA processing and transport
MISDNGAVALAEALKSAPWVSVVHLAGNNLSSRAMTAFADTLQVFLLHQKDIQVFKFVLTFVGALDFNYQATSHNLSINLSDNLIGREGINALTAVTQPLEFKCVAKSFTSIFFKS